MIVALAALVIASQVIGRQLRRENDLSTLRDFGADRAMSLSDSLVGALGSVLAAVVVAGLSFLAPIGPGEAGLSDSWGLI